jgi:hypothetical protein
LRRYADHQEARAHRRSLRQQVSLGGVLMAKIHHIFLWIFPPTPVQCALHARPFAFVFRFPAKELTVTIGEHDRKADTGRKSVHQVAKVHWHPGFQLNTFDNDIAVLELKDPAPIESPWVRLACLPNSGQYLRCSVCVVYKYMHLSAKDLF